jgi:hypothetical protein
VTRMVSGKKGSGRLPFHDWPLWKAVGGSLLLYLCLSALVVLMPPPPSPAIIAIAFLLSATGVVAANWGRLGNARASQVTALFVLTLFFLLIAIRLWDFVLPLSWVWVAPLVAAFILAWVLPRLDSSMSTFLFREQHSPRTRLGRLVLTLALAIGPAAGVLGASVGLSSSRFGDQDLVFVVMAALTTVIAVGWSQSMAHQLFLGGRLRDPA